jgi:hypothetical protein
MPLDHLGTAAEDFQGKILIGRAKGTEPSCDDGLHPFKRHIATGDTSSPVFSFQHALPDETRHMYTDIEKI